MEETIIVEISAKLYDEIVAHVNALGISLDDFITQIIINKLSE